MTLTDLAPTDPLMRQAWVDALCWAIREEYLVARFRSETGNNWSPGRTPIDAMIDQASCADREFALSFARWFNRMIWGEKDGQAINGDEADTERKEGK